MKTLLGDGKMTMDEGALGKPLSAAPRFSNARRSATAHEVEPRSTVGEAREASLPDGEHKASVMPDRARAARSVWARGVHRQLAPVRSVVVLGVALALAPASVAAQTEGLGASGADARVDADAEAPEETVPVAAEAERQASTSNVAPPADANLTEAGTQKSPEALPPASVDPGAVGEDVRRQLASGITDPSLLEPPMPNEEAFDWLQFDSGEWLGGDLKEMRDGRVTFDSDKMDVFTEDWDDVVEFRSGRRYVYVDAELASYEGASADHERHGLCSHRGGHQDLPPRSASQRRCQ